MGKTADKLSDIAKRCGDLSPLREPVTRVLRGGNTRDRMQGLDNRQRLISSYAPLKPSTIKHRRSASGHVNKNAPAFVPGGEASRAVAAYQVQVTAGPGELRFIAGWPSVPWMEYHLTGRGRLPKRDILGFNPKDLDYIRGMLAPYVLRRGIWARLTGR